MKTKIVGIFIVTLLIATTIPVIGINENGSNSISSTFTGINRNEFEPQDVPPEWLEGADQYQTDDYAFGMIICPLYHIAQEFKPTKEDLTAVALYFFNSEAPSNTDITVSIRDSLDGVDLTTKTINADDKKIKTSRWVMFDFDDITVIPEETYYIVCYASDGGTTGNCYVWYFDVGNKYDRGIAYQSGDSGETWTDLEDAFGDPEFVELDLWFITYFQEPPKSKATSTPILNFLQNFLQQYPILYQLLLRFLRL